MTRLQKRAWIDLASTTVCIIISAAGVGLAVHFNVKGVGPLVSFVIGGLIMGLISALRSIAIQAKFDERERKIAVKALIIASKVFVIFSLCVSFIILFIVGGKGSVPVYIVPVLFLAGLLLAQFIESAVILIQFAQEQVDEQ